MTYGFYCIITHVFPWIYLNKHDNVILREYLYHVDRILNIHWYLHQPISLNHPYLIRLDTILGYTPHAHVHPSPRPTLISPPPYLYHCSVQASILPHSALIFPWPSLLWPLLHLSHLIFRIISFVSTNIVVPWS
jgi:hypothetical protein